MNPRQLSLIDAVIHGDTEAVRALLAAGSDVNETAHGGRTPLILAILFRRAEIITLLLEAGADPHQRDSSGLNAVDWAQRKGLNLLNQTQGQKLKIPPVTPSNESTPRGELAPSQSENQTTRASAASREWASDDEKSRRWLAGIKRRIDEEGSNKTKEVEPTSPPTTQVEATRGNEPRHVPVDDSLVEASPHEPERAVISGPVERLPNFQSEALLEDQISPAQTLDPLGPPDDVETLGPALLTIEEPPPRSSHRKRCPKCNTVYDSELLAYCAIDMTPLVDADQPLFTSPPETAGIPLVWLLVVLTFIVAAGVTYFMIPYLMREPNAPTATSPTRAQSIPDAPAVGAGLSGKQLEVPAAEYPARARSEHVIGTVTVRVTVNKEGKVIAVKVLDGDSRLRKAAIAAALKATFSAEKLTERETVGTVTYTFKE